MGNVVTFVKLMESAGMGRVTELGKVIAQQGDDVIREVVFANGRRGTYRVSNFMGTKTQSVWDGVRSVEFATSKGNQSYFQDFLSVNGRDIELFPNIHGWKIRQTLNGQRDTMKTLATGSATVTPLKVERKMVNGKIRQKVLSNQEIHTCTRLESDKGFGTIYERKDILLDTQGKSHPIYQRANEYVPASNAGFGQDLSKGQIVYSPTTGYMTRYTGQTPVKTLNRDLGANFQSPLKPLWSRLEEMFWHLG